jgi:DNA (cytosine-5)-methyltransferase 1
MNFGSAGFLDHLPAARYDQAPTLDTKSVLCESYEIDAGGRRVLRFVTRRDGSKAASEVPLSSASTTCSPDAVFDISWLKLKERPAPAAGSAPLRVADLFSGCGGLSLGVQEAARALGIPTDFIFASDILQPALDVYKANFNPHTASSAPLECLVDGPLHARVTEAEAALVRQLGRIDMVVAGPPCQGHSDLNNHTRRNDPKNRLITRVARFVELFEPATILIENVQGIRHDKSGSLSEVKDFLDQIGYSFSEALMRADHVGAAQSRRRYFLVAGRNGVQDLTLLTQSPPVTLRPLAWAIEDLLVAEPKSVFDSAARHSAENQSRIEFLHRNDLHELPDGLRPPCHRDKPHAYTSVYGRMFWDRPAPTITTGFGSTGQGRFVHPLRTRTLTPHEAARVQFFPDFFKFGERGRREYQQLIGNAVPSKLAYVAALHQLR